MDKELTWTSRRGTAKKKPKKPKTDGDGDQDDDDHEMFYAE